MSLLGAVASSFDPAKLASKVVYPRHHQLATKKEEEEEETAAADQTVGQRTASHSLRHY